MKIDHGRKRHITASQRDFIIRSLNEGKTKTWLAKYFHMAYSTLDIYINKMGIDLPKEEVKTPEFFSWGYAKKIDGLTTLKCECR